MRVGDFSRLRELLPERTSLLGLANRSHADTVKLQNDLISDALTTRWPSREQRLRR